MVKPPVKSIGLHFLGWVLFFSLIIGFTSYSPEGRESGGLPVLPFLLFAGLYVFIFYVNAYVLVPGLYLKKKYALYTLLILLLFTAVFFLKPYDQLAHLQQRPPGGEGFPPFAEGPRMRGRPEVHLDIVSIVLFICVWSVSTVLQVLRQWRLTERRALAAEAEKVQAELSFLKAQVNPHFLFNTLNNIYALAISRSEQTPEAILKLSRMLRYITDDAGSDLVPLQSEVDCVNNYIELQKLRLSSKAEVRFEVKGDTAGKQIAPLLFMTFVENAFKYGISSHQPCFIHIEIITGEERILFLCRNRLLAKEETERAGIGMGNAVKRLDYLYPGKHSLDINTEDGNFSVSLALTN